MLLPQNQRTVLTVLSFLFLRMGLFDKARRSYATLVALAPENETPDELSRLALAGLASAELEMDDAENAARHIDLALQGHPLSSRQLPLLLLKARALWHLRRYIEARDVFETWTQSSGSTAVSDLLKNTQTPSGSPANVPFSSSGGVVS